MHREPNNAWLLLIVSLPTNSATTRMRVWRALKANGCVALRDGAYLLPSHSDHEKVLQALADECVEAGGSAWLMNVRARSEDEARSYTGLFDRSDDYVELRASWKETNRTLRTLAPAELPRLQRRLQREYEAVRSIDFFPGLISAEAEAEWQDLSKRVAQALSPDEPHEVEGRIPQLDVSMYQGRLWATRQRLWVDRVASAWLIRRFIDPSATFRWLIKPADCPKDALGFDFDGATFSHVGDRVTFETLMASFGLERDAGLQRLAMMVHQLDVGGEPVAEASGFEAVLTGARERLPDDDALLTEMSTVLDSFYAHFGREVARGKQ